MPFEKGKNVDKIRSSSAMSQVCLPQILKIREPKYRVLIFVILFGKKAREQIVRDDLLPRVEVKQICSLFCVIEPLRRK